MLTEPKIVERGEQPYAGIKASVTMESIGETIGSSMDELFARLGTLRIEPSGAPFVRYNVIDMERRLEIEIGVPVAQEIAGDGRVTPGVLPAGRYASVTHIGPYEGLVGANAALQEWAEARELRLAMSETPDGDTFESRLEVYLTDPAEEPDPQKWETEVAYLLADS
jgi:effector-binding domain-containing protein